MFGGFDVEVGEAPFVGVARRDDGDDLMVPLPAHRQEQHDAAATGQSDGEAGLDRLDAAAGVAAGRRIEA